MTHSLYEGKRLDKVRALIDTMVTEQELNG